MSQLPIDCYSFDLFREINLTSLDDAITDRWFWAAHIYGFAFCWCMLGLYCFVSSINLRSSAPNRTILNVIFAFLCTTSILRSIYLIVDAYETKGRFPVYVSRVLLMLVHPCFLYVFCLCFLALLRTTKITIWPYQLQNTAVLITILFATFVPIQIFEIFHCLWCRATLPVYWSFHIAFLLLTFFVVISYFHCASQMCRSLSGSSSNGFTCYRVSRKHSPNGTAYADATLDTIQVPKINITDENDCTISFKSELSLNSNRDAILESSSNTDNFINSPVGPKGATRNYVGKTQSTRPQRLRQLIRSCYVVAVLTLLLIFWQFYDIIGQYIWPAKDKLVWPLFVFATIERYAQLLRYLLAIVLNMVYGFRCRKKLRKM